MTVIWLVTAKRFLQEYHNHIRNTPEKYVNWFVESNGNIRMYIEQTHGSNMYCYVHAGPLPEEFKSIISEKGEVLGMTEEYENDDTDIEQKLDELSTRIKFNMMGDTDD